MSDLARRKPCGSQGKARAVSGPATAVSGLHMVSAWLEGTEDKTGRNGISKTQVPPARLAIQSIQLLSLVVFILSAISIRCEMSISLKFSSLMNRIRFIASG